MPPELRHSRVSATTWLLAATSEGLHARMMVGTATNFSITAAKVAYVDSRHKYMTMVLVTACHWMSTPRVAHLGAQYPVVVLVGGSGLVLERPLNALPLTYIHSTRGLSDLPQHSLQAASSAGMGV